MIAKNKYIIILLISLIAFALYFFNRQPQIKNFPPKNNTIVAFGDSLVEGYGSTADNDFVSLLSKKIEKPIINLGKSGDTTENGLARISNVSELNPGTVILLLGGNDYLKKVPKEITFNNLREIIKRLQSQNTFVILLGIRGGILNDHFDESFKKLANEMQVLYVPNVLDGLLGDSRYMFDIIHPNDVGYLKISEKIYNITHDYISK